MTRVPLLIRSSLAVTLFLNLLVHAQIDPRRDAPNLTPFSATYQVYAGGMRVGVMTRQLRRTAADEFTFESVTTTTGLARLLRQDVIREVSRWRAADTRIRILGYEYHHAGGGKNRDARVEFDYETQTIRNVINGSEWRTQIEDGVVDKLIYQILIMADLSSGKNDLEYKIADGGGIKTYRFQTLGNETLQTPAGRFETIKLQRYKPGDERTTILWCARELAYLPVRVDYLEKDGSRSSALLRHFEPVIAD